MKQKQVGKAPAPAAPVALAPTRTLTSIIVATWDNKSDKYRNAIEAFAVRVAAEGADVAEAIEWNGYDAMVASSFLSYEMRWTKSFIEPLRTVQELPDDLQTLAKLQEAIEAELERIEGELLGREGLGSGGSGPWAPNSTNPLANVRAVARCHAKREALEVCRRMLRLLDGE